MKTLFCNHTSDNEEDNQEHQIFLYKRNYRLAKYGKPRFHIRSCQTIQDFINSGALKSEYRRANTEPVLVIDMDNMQEVEVRNLSLCRYCVNMAMGEYSVNMTSSDFIGILKHADGTYENRSKNVAVDIFG